MPYFESEELGRCYIEISVSAFSSVDCYADKGYSEKLERDLTEDELDSFQSEVEEFAYSEGLCINHN